MNVVIHLTIDQNIPAQNVTETVNKYIDELAKTTGKLTWNDCHWTTTETETAK
jgi:hypothetical protein